MIISDNITVSCLCTNPFQGLNIRNFHATCVIHTLLHVTESWPSVLVVANSANIVSLFAVAENTAWHFWPPEITRSSAMSEYRTPYSAIINTWSEKE